MDSIRTRRLTLLRRELQRRGLDALVVVHRPNIFYLTGFTGSSGALLLRQGSGCLFTDGRYRLQARQEAHHCAIKVARRGLLAELAERLQGVVRNQRVGFEAQHLSEASLQVLRKAAGPRVSWQSTSGLVERFRAVKDEFEIGEIRQAGEVATGVLGEVLKLVRPGVTELELAAEIEYRMRGRGASGAAFETIVASGTRSAMPHARPTSKLLRKNELVVFDLGAILRAYSSDLTRTVFLGTANSRVRKWYSAVRDARDAAENAIREGIRAADVDDAARRVLHKHGLERRFTHSTGHGLGLEVHEQPRLASGQPVRLAAGNVVTIEPGIYVEGFGGIRIEDDVVVLPGGGEVLTDFPRELIEL